MAVSAVSTNTNPGGIINDMNDPAGSIECLCDGNMGYFFPANAEGLIVWENHPSEKVAPWPSEADMHALCCTCGNLFSHADLAVATTPEVQPVKVVDFSEPKHRENLEAFQMALAV